MELLVAMETGSGSKRLPQSAGIAWRMERPQNQELRGILELT